MLFDFFVLTRILCSNFCMLPSLLQKVTWRPAIGGDLDVHCWRCCAKYGYTVDDHPAPKLYIKGSLYHVRGYTLMKLLSFSRVLSFGWRFEYFSGYRDIPGSVVPDPL